MRNVRIILLFTALALICIGVVMIYSASSIYVWEKTGDANFYLKRQLLYLLVGFILTFIVMSFDYRRLKKYAKPLFLFSLFLLVLVFVFGKEAGGAKRWFRLFGVSFQPSELTQLCLIIYLADFISRRQNMMRNFWYGFIPPIIFLGMAFLLVIIQPDLGTAVSLAVITFVMLFVAGIKAFNLALCFLAALPILYVLVFSVPYRRARILAFLNPWLDPKGSGFQIIQSQIALGSGGIWGVGLGQGKQKLFYLPAAHTDFIFSIIGEELGLIGTLAVIGLFILFIWQAALICRYAADSFGKFLGLGIICMIALKATINIGASVGFLPTKGLPLPFISYGGTSLIFDMVALGLLLNISRSNEDISYG